MTYTKQNFEDGQVLKAEHLNHMEDGISKSVRAYKQEVPSDTLTWDGNTEGLEANGQLYKVSDAVVLPADLSQGFTVTAQDGTTIAVALADCQITDEAVIYDVCVFPTSGGVYLLNTGSMYVTSLTIPGYTGFTKTEVKTIDPEYLPKALQFGDVDVVLYEGNNLEPTLDNAAYVLTTEVGFAFAEEKQYTVVIDGVKYTSESFLLYGVLPSIGNPAMLGVGDDNGLTFVSVVDGNVLSFVSTVNFNALTIFTAEAKKVDEKYLPSLPGAVMLYIDDTMHLYADSDTSNTAKRITKTQLLEYMKSSRPIYVDIYNSGDGFTLCGVFSCAEDYCKVNDLAGNTFYTAEYTAE